MQSLLATLIALIFIFGHSLFAYGAAISTSFAEVILKDLEIGKSYSTKGVANMPLCVRNIGKESVDLKIDVLIPQLTSLKNGYEAIPDASWIRLEKDFFSDLRPGEQAITDVILTIPENKQYSGKKYQVYLRSHTVGKKGMAIAVGLRSRLLFTMRAEIEKAVNEVKPKRDKKELSGEGFFKKLLRWIGLRKK